MTSMMRTVVVSMATLAIGGSMACDPKVAGPGDEDAELQGDSDEDSDEDGDEDGNTSVATSDSDDDGVEPGTSVGSGPDEPDCEGGENEACPDLPPPVLHAYAIRYGDLPPIDVDTDTGGSGGSGGDEIDPDTLILTITTGPDDCDDPWAALQCGQWNVSVNLPPGTEAGAHELAELDATQIATGPDEGSGDCWWGGGSLEGTIELDSVTGPIVGRIVDAQSFDFDANVEFSAVICE